MKRKQEKKKKLINFFQQIHNWFSIGFGKISTILKYKDQINRKKTKKIPQMRKNKNILLSVELIMHCSNNYLYLHSIAGISRNRGSCSS